MTVICHRCGDEWPRHPALEVACPDCRAGVGVRCTRPSGHAPSAAFQPHPHRAREQAAVDTGVLPVCRALTWDGRHTTGTAPPPAPARRSRLRADAPPPPAQATLF